MREKILTPGLREAAYPGNVGFEEMVKFYKLADKSELKQMEKVLDKEDWKGFKNLIEKVLGEKLI